MPSLDELHQTIRKVAFDINNRITTLEYTIGNSSDPQLQTLNNLRECLRSAATIVSSASTALGVVTENGDDGSEVHGSEFGECFPSQQNETMQRWISSNTVYEFEAETKRGESQDTSKGKETSDRNIDGEEDIQLDSDDELEIFMIHSLMRKSESKLQAHDYDGAERMLRNCLARISASKISFRPIADVKKNILRALMFLLKAQKRWSEARIVLLDEITSSPHKNGDHAAISDFLELAGILYNMDAYTEALLYGRKALKGFRKLGPESAIDIEKTLKLLVKICSAANDRDEEDAYSAMLSEHTEQLALRNSVSLAEISASTIHQNEQNKTVGSVTLGNFLVSTDVRSIHRVDDTSAILATSAWSLGPDNTSTKISALPHTLDNSSRAELPTNFPPRKPITSTSNNTPYRQPSISDSRPQTMIQATELPRSAVMIPGISELSTQGVSEKLGESLSARDSATNKVTPSTKNLKISGKIFKAPSIREDSPSETFASESQARGEISSTPPKRTTISGKAKNDAAIRSSQNVSTGVRSTIISGSGPSLPALTPLNGLQAVDAIVDMIKMNNAQNGFIPAIAMTAPSNLARMVSSRFNQRRRNVVIVGLNNCGKTSLIRLV